MTIGLEATRANKDKKTGTEWYAWHLLQQFKNLDKDTKFIVYHNNDLAVDLVEGPANFSFRKLSWPFAKFWTHLRLSWELLVRPVDIFLATNAVPFFMRGKVVAVIHDLGFMNNPELYHPLERIYHKVSHYWAARRADKILTISQATKVDIVKYYPWAADKVKVVYLGWDTSNFAVIEHEQKESIKDKFAIKNNFILYVGRVETKKNIQNLIRAYKMMDTSLDLVIAGRPGNYGYDEIRKLAADSSNIKLLGYIAAADYSHLLAAASIFAFPSKFEGFGIPPLEAMGSGVPVAVSDIPVLHEVCAEAALYFDPDSPSDIATKLQNLSQDRGVRDELITRGLKRSRNFSWAKCAQETLNYIKG